MGLGAMGLLGAFCMVGMYWALEARKIRSTQPVFYVVNGLGALLVLVSLGADFDSGDLGGLVTEGSWLVISIIGLVRVLRRRRRVLRQTEQRRTRRQRRAPQVDPPGADLRL